MGSDIVEGARSLLVEAVKANGAIIFCRDVCGLRVEVDGKNFADKGNRRSEALWEEVIRELRDNGLIEKDADGIYLVTHAGFLAADGWSKKSG